ncbi:MAG: lactate permease LctP family transporter [Bacteroidetes bacterium]|nr:lactate permease LctP family transporter [Bacteroidota bacterium]MBS1929986.1 lactate permease LctP family transporter [Bacteroidota bacterium]
MIWPQIVDPLHNILLSALIASVPILFIFWGLVVKKMKGYKASLIATGLAIIIAIGIYRMPLKLAFLSTANGVLYGLFPICWIVIAALFLFNITKESGQFEVIKHFIASITPDRRLQALLIAFSFGSFLEGTAGFGAPVAITAAMLVGLGFNPLYAAGFCLIANTAPVAFGSIGIPITVASQISSIPEMALSQMVGRTLPLLSLVLPFYLVIMMCGFKKSKEVLPAIFVSGFSFAIIQWACSNFLGPALPDILAGIGSIMCLFIFLRFWKPKRVWQFETDSETMFLLTGEYALGKILKAFSPFILLTIMIIAWGIQPIKETLNSFGQIEFNFPGIHNMIKNTEGKLIPHIFKFNFLSAAGTAIFISAILVLPVIGLSFYRGMKIFLLTFKQLRFPIITVASVLGFAYLLNDSGITLTLAAALASTGVFFPFFAPILGWLGVFITGSDTSSNALFSKVQAVTAISIGVDPLVTVAGNVSGGVIGKMISPSSIAVAAAAGNLIGRESDLFRFTLKHSFKLLGVICSFVLAQAYILKWMLPGYQLHGTETINASENSLSGYWYILVLGFIVAAILVYLIWISDKSKAGN